MSPEDQLDVFGKYYGLPSLSWRDTVHDLIAHNVTGFKVSDLYADKGHPNGYNGHRCTLHVLTMVQQFASCDACHQTSKTREEKKLTSGIHTMPASTRTPSIAGTLQT